MKGIIMATMLAIPDLSTSGLFELPQQLVKWQLLKTALELKIFDCLSAPITAEELSHELSTDPVNTGYLLDSLTAIGCITKEGDRFLNTPSTEACWKSTGKTSLLKSYLFMSQWSEPMLNGGMTELVRKGSAAADHSRKIGNADIWKKAAYASLNHTRCSRAQAMADTVRALPEFPGFRKILDLGAGSGIIGVAITLAHPDLNCVLFDQPAVCEVAQEVIDEYALQDRVSVMPGNYMEDPLGTGYDFIIANFTLNFFRDNLEPIFAKIFAALNPGGIFMVSSDGMEESGTAPEATVLSWLPTRLQGADMAFRKGEIAAKMHEAGFNATERHTLNKLPLEAHGPIEITIGRKRAE